MTIRVNIYTSKIMCTPIKVGVHTYAIYSNCQTLNATKTSYELPPPTHTHINYINCQFIDLLSWICCSVLLQDFLLDETHVAIISFLILWQTRFHWNQHLNSYFKCSFQLLQNNEESCELYVTYMIIILELYLKTANLYNQYSIMLIHIKKSCTWSEVAFYMVSSHFYVGKNMPKIFAWGSNRRNMQSLIQLKNECSYRFWMQKVCHQKWTFLRACLCCQKQLKI